MHSSGSHVDLGQPIAYMVLAEGTPVYDRNGDRAGAVERVVADPGLDIFEGLVVRVHPLGRHVFIEAMYITELHEHGVLLSVDRDVLHPRPA